MHPSTYIHTLILLLAVVVLSGCGTAPTSTLHTRSQIREATALGESPATLPEVKLQVGERVKAYRSRPGLLMGYWGYIPSLRAEDPSIVKCETVPAGRGFDTYLTGLREGTTKIYRANGLVPEPEQRRAHEAMGAETYFYTLQVETSME